MLSVPEIGTNMDTTSLKNVSILTDKTNANDKPLGHINAVCLVADSRHDPALPLILEGLHLLILASETGEEYVDRNDVAFVLDEFCGPIFETLREAGRTIYGPTSIKEFATMKQDLVPMKRPLYCQPMDKIVVCLSGFRNTAVMEELVNLIHYMGGSVRKKYTAKVTHLVAATTQGDKYRLAVGAGIPVMSEEWVRKAWDKRRTAMCYAFSDEMKKYKLPAFFQLKLTFYGFSMDDTMAMEVRAHDLGGEVTEPADCTHLVVFTSSEAPPPEKPNNACHVVTVEWFYTSVHLDVCANELEYSLYNKARVAVTSPSASVASGLCTKRRRSVGLSGASLFEMSNEASSLLGDHMFTADDLENLMKSPPKRGYSKRHQICLELLQTETNYVHVLKTIVMVFKEPLEKLDPYGNRMLNPTELKAIFGNIPDILAVHEGICGKLGGLIYNWDDSNCIGRVWVESKDELIKSYPSFVNYFEDAKETLTTCALKNPRFQAFLKACQSKPECARQGLQDLLIRPVQRLPSVILLLKDLLKHTDKYHEDWQWVQQAIVELDHVLTHLNEGKRRTEGQKQMFDIVQVIEGCPPHLLSSQRQLLAEVEVEDLSGSFTKRRNAVIVFYLFNDCMEVAKQVHFSTSKRSFSGLNKQKALKTKKHKDLIPLPRIRQIINVTNCHAGSEIFCLTIRDDMSDRSYAFSFLGYAGRGSGSNLDLLECKRTFLNQLCDHIVMTTGRPSFSCQDYTYDQATEDGGDIGETIKKAVRCSKGGTGTLTRSVSVKRSNTRTSGTFRRAISHAVMNLASGTLRRMSRSNLRMPLQDIVEEAAVNVSKSRNDSSLMIRD